MTADEQGKLLETARNAAALIGAVYQWVDMVNAAGGPTCISGIAKCKAMLDSLEKNRARTDKLVMAPLIASIEQAK